MKTALPALRADPTAAILIGSARRREVTDDAAGDMLDFGLLVVDEARRAERDRVLPAVQNALARSRRSHWRSAGGDVEPRGVDHLPPVHLEAGRGLRVADG